MKKVRVRVRKRGKITLLVEIRKAWVLVKEQN